MMKSKLKNVFKKATALALALLTAAGTAAVAPMPVSAESTSIMDTVSELVGGAPIADGEWHSLGTYNYPTYSWGQIADMDAGSIRRGMDCSRSAIWLFSHYFASHGKSLGDMGINAGSRFVMGSKAADMLRNSTLTEYDSFDEAKQHENEPGMLVLYGTGDYGHITLTLGDGYVWDYGTDGGAGSPGIYRIRSGGIVATGSSDGSSQESFAYAFSPGPQTKDAQVSVNIHKYSVNPSVTDNNPNYSLAGAVFNIYQSWDGQFVTQITTDENGNASFAKTYTGLPIDTDTSSWSFTLTEATPSKGYLVTPGSWTPGNGGTANVPESGINDPTGVNVKKISADGLTNPKNLKDAVFTMHFYAVDPSTVNSIADLDGLDHETWTLNTNADGQGSFLDVKGNNHTDSMGKYVVPKGVLTIEETSAPEGYTLENKTLDINGKQLSAENGVVMLKIIDSRSTAGASIVYGNEYTVADTPIRGGFKMQKLDAESGDANFQGTKRAINAKFDVINDNDYDTKSIDADGTERSAAPGEVVYSFTTADDGSYVSYEKLLSYGSYTLREVEAPEGYKLDGSTTETSFTISTDGQMIDIGGAIKDAPIRGGFTFQKFNAEDNSTTAEGDGSIGSAEYKVTSDNDWHVRVGDKWYEKGDTVYTFTTDESGAYASAADLLPYGQYTITETKAPNGLTLDPDISASFFVKEDGKLVSVNDLNADHIANRPIRGNFTFIKRDTDDKSTDAQGSASLVGGHYQVINSSNKYVIVDGKHYEPGEVVYEFDLTADSLKNGVFTAPENLLPYGTYTLKETKAPEGYELITDNGSNISVTFSIRKDGETVDLTGINDIHNEIQRGYFTIQKNDLDLGTNIAQGDNDLSAKFALINRSEHAVYVDANSDGRLDLKAEKFAPGDVIFDRANADASKKTQTSFVTAKDGTYEWAHGENGSTEFFHGLPYGSYEVKELEAPVNYTTAGNTSVTFDITADGQLVNRKVGHTPGAASKDVISNQPAYGQVEIYKHVNKQSGSEEDDVYENNAQFLVVLTSKLNSLYGGDMQKAWDALHDHNGENITDASGKVVLSAHEFSIMTTGTEKNADGKVMNGYALSGKLATGNYSIMQFVSGSAKGYTADDLKMKDEVKSVTITSNQTTTADGYRQWTSWKDIEDGNRLSVTNDEKLYTLRVIKKDARTGKTVTLNSASFQVYVDLNGNGRIDDEDKAYNSVKDNGDIDYTYYKDGELKIVNGIMTMTSGQKDYDTFRTYSDHTGKFPAGTFVVDTINGEKNDKGSAVQPVRLKKGSYIIVEHDSTDKENSYTPARYLKYTDSGLAFTVNGSQYTGMPSSTAENRKSNIMTKVFSWFDNGTRWLTGTKRMELDDEYFVTETIYNDRALGELDVRKTIEPEPDDVDYTYINRNDLSGIGFELRAAEDIIDPADGSVIVKKGDLAKVLTDNGGHKDTYVTAGAFHVNKDGSYKLSDLPIGKYTLKEIKVPDGIVLQGDKSWDVVISQPDDDRHTSVFNVSYDIENYTTKTKLHKVEASDSDKAVTGATLTILHKDGSQVYRADGQPLTWQSTDKAYFIEGLPVGEYLLHETVAADGYVLRTSDVPFTVKNDSAEISVKMEDKSYFLSKTDVGGKEVPYAQFSVTDKESGEVVDTWTSTKDSVKNPHRIEGLVEGRTYIIAETSTPDIYVTMEPVEITVSSDYHADQSVTLVNKAVSVSKLDAGGKERKGAEMMVLDKDGNIIDMWTSDGTDHRVSGLIEGHDYILRENAAPDGYVRHTDIPFTATGEVNGRKEDQHFTVIDKSVTALKLDMCGRAVEGAEITVYGTKDGKIDESDVRDKFVTSEKGYQISGLTAGETYVARETRTPDGYVTMGDYTFTVKDDDKDQTESLTDKRVAISKTDVGGHEVEGAKMSITDENDKVVDSWTSGAAAHYASGLEVGKTYTLHEDTAPLGYVKTTDVKFTVTDDGVDQKVTMVDTAERVAKVDAKGEPVKGAQMQAVDEDGNILDQWVSGQHIVDLTKDDATALKGGSKVVKEGKDDGETIMIYPLSDKAEKDAIIYDKDGHVADAKQACKVFEDAEKTASDGKVKKPTHYQAIVSKSDDNGAVTVRYYDIDLDGNETTHMVSGLTVGQKYTVQEVKAPDTYVKSPDISTTANDGTKDNITKMVDYQYIFEKVTPQGKAVKGAEITVYELDDNENLIKADGEVVQGTDKDDVTIDENGDKVFVDKDGYKIADRWTTDGKPHYVGGLEVGKAYLVRETVTPNGFVTAADVVIHVGTDKDSSLHHRMVDKMAIVQKLDEKNHRVKGAELTIYDASGKEVDKWISDGKHDHVIRNLMVGQTYTVKETKVPDGYEKAEDVTFTLKDDGKNQTFRMYDKHSDDSPDTGVSSSGAVGAAATALIAGAGLIYALCEKYIIAVISKKRKKAKKH